MTDVFRISSFGKYIDTLYSQVFVQNPSIRERFVPESWLEILLPELILVPSEDDESLARLLEAAHIPDWGEVIAQSPEVLPVDREVFLVRPRVDALAKAFNEPSIGHVDHVIFDTSAEWGVFSSNEFDYTAIGGSADFIREVASLLGGVDGIRHRFEKYWVSEAVKNSFSPSDLLDSVTWPE